jgi:hypothetical protein
LRGITHTFGGLGVEAQEGAAEEKGVDEGDLLLCCVLTGASDRSRCFSFDSLVSDTISPNRGPSSCTQLRTKCSTVDEVISCNERWQGRQTTSRYEQLDALFAMLEAVAHEHPLLLHTARDKDNAVLS